MTVNYSDKLFNNMSRNSVEQTESVADKPLKISKGRNAAGVLTGAAIGLAVPLSDLCDTFIKHEVDTAQKESFISRFMPDFDTFENTQKNINKLLTEKGLDKKGVEFLPYDASSKSIAKIESAIGIDYSSKTKLIERLKNNILVDVINGENAFYAGKSKKIVVNSNQLYNSAYHELGHAINAHSSFGKILKSGRMLTPFGVSLIAPIALVVGLLHKTDNTVSKINKSKKERGLDFIKNNAGALTLASYLPVLSEEALASIRGVKAAKSCLKPSQLSVLKSNYIKAWGTYGAGAALVSAGVALGIKAADAIRNRGKH